MLEFRDSPAAVGSPGRVGISLKCRLSRAAWEHGWKQEQLRDGCAAGKAYQALTGSNIHHTWPTLSELQRRVSPVDSSGQGSSQSNPLDVAGRIPEDQRNTAPEVRARYRYQDECAALAILRHLGSGDLEGAFIEHSTDLILVPSSGMPELVSIKHRESNQAEANTWSWSALRRQRVLGDLYRAWISVDRRCTLAFWTNSGFSGPSAYNLWRACALGENPTRNLIIALSKELHISNEEAEAFIAALTLPEDPLPRRREITDIGIRRTADLLRNYRSSSATHAEVCYRELVSKIARAGTDLPEAEADPPPPIAATLAEVISNRQNTRLMRRYLPARQTLETLLRLYDQHAASLLPEAGQRGWEPDAHFTGRSRHLEDLSRLLAPGGVKETAPVVIHGMPGCGKTSLAAQFASQHKGTFKAIFINASTRAALIRDLAALAGYTDTSTWDTGISELQGPITPTLPGNSATLLLLDGVTDPGTVRGIVPRSSLCRVLITSTTSHLEQGYKHLELQCWSRPESIEFIELAFPETLKEDREKLAAALSDHPLAITQAVNYCRVTGRSIGEYLIRLQQEPVNLLDRGRASGHLDSVVRTIRMSMEAAEERWPDCTYLLSLLSHLGNDPVDESLLKKSGGLAFVSTRAASRDGRNSRISKVPIRLARRRTQDMPLAYHCTALGARVADLLKDDTWRDCATETLLMTSLVTSRGTGLITHPLVARVVRELSGDPRPWLEVGFGLFIGLDALNLRQDFTAVDPHLDHLFTLASAGLNGQFGGPAVLGACYMLAQRAGVIAGGVSEVDRGPTAIEFGRSAVRLAKEQSQEKPSIIWILAEAQHALASALVRAGRLGEAMLQLRSNLELGRRYENDSILVVALADIASLASMDPNPAVAEEALRELNDQYQNISLNSKRQMSIWFARARLLRRIGNTTEAAACLEEATRIAEQVTGLEEKFWAEMYDLATMLARDRDEGSSVFDHAMTALEIRRRTTGDRPDSQFIEALASTADAAIDASELTQAGRLIDEAERLARAGFGTESITYAHVLTPRGRLNLLRGEPRKALHDLEYAVEVFRQQPEVDPTLLPAPLVHIAQAALHLGSREKARRSIIDAYEIDLSIYGPNHPETEKDREIMRSMGIHAND